MIVHELRDAALALCQGKTVRKAVCGSCFTAVQLSDGSVGISFRYGNLDDCRYTGTMAGRPAEDLVNLVVDGNLGESSVGFATINALTAPGRDKLPSQSIYDCVDFKETDTIGVIGNFGKFLNPMREKCKKVMVFEMREGHDLYPAWSEPLYLPECDIVICTGATLINKTVDSVLASSTKAREFILMGPTAVHLPEVFKKHGVTVLGGAEVMEPEKSLLYAMEGGDGPRMTSLTRSYFARV